MVEVDARAKGRPGGGKNPFYEYYFFVGDTHDGGVVPDLDGDGFVTDPNARQQLALAAVIGKSYPLGGFVEAPTAIIQLGDLVHEDSVPPDRMMGDYYYAVRGNHDGPTTANAIISRHGSLTWGYKIGRVFMQALTENYVSFPNNTTPPDAAQISGVVASQLAARPSNEPKFVLMHRALTNASGLGSPETGGYQAEWDAAAKDALEALVVPHRVIGMFQGHNHYSYSITWRGIPIFSPGSVAQAPMSPPYTTTYPESFLVVRVAHNYYDVASFCFGYNVARVWTPGVWEFSQRVNF